MHRGRLVAGCTVALALAGSASAAAYDTSSAGSISNLRGAAAVVIQSELSGDGATACSKLYAPLATTVDGRTCAQRWTSRSARLLAKHGGAARLRADLRVINTAPIQLNGLYATIKLPHPLLGGTTHFYWTANCWMLMNG
jgi:hypothetical protein